MRGGSGKSVVDFAETMALAGDDELWALIAPWAFVLLKLWSAAVTVAVHRLLPAASPHLAAG